MYIFILYFIRVGIRQNLSLLETCSKKQIIYKTKNMPNIDHYHGDEVRHM